jgi:hypothetical protein
MRIRTLPMLVGLMLAVASCGTPPRGASPRGSRDVITRAQMVEVNASTVYDAVQKLNPTWLTSRGPVSVTNMSPTVATVYMSGNEVGDIEFLRSLRPDDVDEVRYYEAGEASARFGMGHPRGVIEVIPRGGQ